MTMLKHSSSSLLVSYFVDMCLYAFHKSVLLKSHFLPTEYLKCNFKLLQLTRPYSNNKINDCKKNLFLLSPTATLRRKNNSTIISSRFDYDLALENEVAFYARLEEMTHLKKDPSRIMLKAGTLLGFYSEFFGLNLKNLPPPNFEKPWRQTFNP